MIRMLTLSTLFPNSAQQSRGIFVEQRLRHLLRTGEVDARVVAPVPWFPSRSERFGRYAQLARVPRRETRYGLEVWHPRYVLAPKITMVLAPLSLAIGVRSTVARIKREGFDFDIIDAHYYYPDGVAGALLARWTGRPLVITARGTDINLIPRYYWPRRMILWASRMAAQSISVCDALREEMVSIGMARGTIRTLRNGVDLEIFAPVDQDVARRKLEWPAGPTLLSVGALIERKGHDVLLRALARLPGYRAVIVGKGNLENKLRTLATRLGVADRVILAGEVSQQELKYYYSAADASVLASSREGWANVLLESMACGTPVIASKVWGSPEVIRAREGGLLMEERTPEILAQCICDLFASPPQRVATRRYAEGFSWEATAAGQIEVFAGILRSAEVSNNPKLSV